jgi:hypothetical protein
MTDSLEVEVLYPAWRRRASEAQGHRSGEMSCDDGLLFVGVDAGAAVTAFTPPDPAARLRPFIRFLRGGVQPT